MQQSARGGKGAHRDDVACAVRCGRLFDRDQGVEPYGVVQRRLFGLVRGSRHYGIPLAAGDRLVGLLHGAVKRQGGVRDGEHAVRRIEQRHTFKNAPDTRQSEFDAARVLLRPASTRVVSDQNTCRRSDASMSSSTAMATGSRRIAPGFYISIPTTSAAIRTGK